MLADVLTKISSEALIALLEGLSSGGMVGERHRIAARSKIGERQVTAGTAALVTADGPSLWPRTLLDDFLGQEVFSTVFSAFLGCAADTACMKDVGKWAKKVALRNASDQFF